jgi:hypothetical protein
VSVRSLSSAESRAAFTSGLRVAAWGLAVYAGAQLVGSAFQALSMAAIVGQAILAEWGLGRLGVTWSDPMAPLPDGTTLAKRAAKGIGAGLLVAGFVTAAVVGTRGAILDPGDGTLAVLAIGLLTSAVVAVRDELLLHGLTLRVLISVPSPLPRALACGVASAAAALGDVGAAPQTVVAHFLLGVIFGSLWIRDRGAWMAWGAHTAFLFLTGTLLHGGLFDIKVAANAWGGGDAGLLGGYAAVAALVPCAILAVRYATRSREHGAAGVRP